MTRSELITRLAGRFPQLVGQDAEISVKMLIDTMCDALVRRDRIEIRSFGSFDVHHRRGRVGRNPKTGEAVIVPAKYVPHFKPGKELRERVDMMDGPDRV